MVAGDVVVRSARPDDAEGLARVHVDSWRETYADLVPASFFGDEAFARRLNMWTRYLGLDEPWGTLTVAEREGELIGFSFAGPASGPDVEKGHAAVRPLRLYSIYLLAADQRSGIGTTLLDAAVGDRPAQLWVARDNDRAIGFYRRHGFEADGIEFADPDIDGLVELRMVR